jgi:outer membrane protein assembly factor BamD (BamD/ComL family)
MTENPLQLATKNWIEAVQKYYENTRSNELTQIHMRGHFSGWSEREIVNLANILAKNEQDYPLWRDRENN